MSDTVLLETSDLTVRYGGVTANSDVTISVGAGEIVGLIGPNGAGKTTFVDAVTGFTKSQGSVSLAGDPLHNASPHRRRRAGMARTWQAGELFTDLTVEQNLAVALQPVGLRAMLFDVINGSRPPARTIAEALDLVGLGEVADRRPGDLSLGQQKLVGVARALVGGTRLVLLDEPAAGLDTHESKAFGAELRRIAALKLMSGTVTALGEPIDRRIERSARRGITLVPDTRGVFHRLSVADNLRLARRRGGRDIDTIYDYFPKLKTMRSRRCGNLSGGEQQMLALAKALLTGPQILLIDEMSLGLSPVAVQDLLPRLRAIADDANMAVVLVGQHIDLALGIADSAMVLHHGRVALSAPAAELRGNRERVEAAYFGRDLEVPSASSGG